MDLQIYRNVFLAVMRYAAPGMAVLLLLRCGGSLLFFRKQEIIWGYLSTKAGQQFPVCHWENLIGRSKRCDIRLELPTVSRNHAVLTRYDDGSWTVSNAHSCYGITVNGQMGDLFVLTDGDSLDIGGVEMTFTPEADLPKLLYKASSGAMADLLLLTVFQFCTCLAYTLAYPANTQHLLLAFGGIAMLQWLLFVLFLLLDKRSFDLETLSFFLCTMGMAVIASVKPGELIKQLVAVGLGCVAYLLVLWSLDVLERAKRLRYVAAILGMLLLVVTLLFGTEYYGAKNWLILGGVSLQPSELTKVCFVYVGASTLDRLVKRRNQILLIAYTIALCGLLALMNDFGTALVFFSAFLMIAYLRSGSLGTVALACTALLFAGVIGLQLAPHALRRIASWRHIWEDPWGAGFQQTQAFMCIAAGGLFGLGIGQGKMKGIFAADSDMVFATVSEEWGLVMAVLLVMVTLLVALFAFRCAKYGRSGFYVIAACTAAGILLVQTMLNVLGTLDVLPLTGVTFPMVANGGSSMISVWALMGFLRAGDVRMVARREEKK